VLHEAPASPRDGYGAFDAAKDARIAPRSCSAGRRRGALVVLPVVVKPFVGPDKPYTGSNLGTYASGLVTPTYVTAAPGEPKRLYVVEQAGRIRYLAGRRIAGTFLDIRSSVSSGGERGLLSVAFSPRYARNHRFYVNYTDRNGDTRVVEFRSRGGHALLDSARLLLFVKQPYPNHNGGQVQFGPDGLLYVGMGDGGAGGDPQNRAQNLRERLGKLLRTDPHARPAHWQTIGYGLRNPWRFSFDRATGDLYIGDVGQSTGRKWTSARARSSTCSQTTAGGCSRGGRASRPTLRGRQATSSRRSASTPTKTVARSPAATSTAGATCSPPSAATPSATSAPGTSSACASRAGGRPGCTRTDRRALELRRGRSGELYATSLNGRIYRLQPAASG
jgi:Glucose / Sorbosone dehydrogenase